MANQRVVLLGRLPCFAGRAVLRRARYGGNGDVVVSYAQFLQGAAADFEHFAADFVGKAGLYDADARVCAVEVQGAMMFMVFPCIFER